MFPTIDVVWQPGSRGQIRYQRKEETIRNQKKSVSLISDICGCGKSHSRILVVLTSCGKKKAICFTKVEYQKEGASGSREDFPGVLPEQGLAVREEQIRLCHEMLDTLLGERIALCDAGVGIGKTYAYLVACVLLRKYSMLTGRGIRWNSVRWWCPLPALHCRSHSNRIYSIFIQGAVGTRHDPVSSSGSGAERKGTLCL